VNIRILYRTWTGSNDKPRPPWYSLAACLLSLHEAAAGSPYSTSFTFVADGGIPPELAEHVRPEDTVLRITAGTAAASLRATVAAAVTSARTAPDDLFWLCEDDYLYRPDAFAHLARAVERIPEADYFSIFCPRPSGWSLSHPSQPNRHFPEIPSGPRLVEPLRWRRFPGTTSTFGVRGRALLRDAGLITLGTRPGAPFDGATWHMLQGARPYSWRHLFRDIDPYLTHRGLAKIVGKPVMRVALNVAAIRVARHPRMLVVPDRNLAVHVEIDEVDGDAEWEALSKDVVQRHTKPA